MTRVRFFLLLILFSAGGVSPVSSGQVSSPVTASHLLMIESLFHDNGLDAAGVALDRNGRVLLKGHYQDSRQVSLAFSLAQSVVGVKWTSPVTPEHIKVREWARNLSTLFPTRRSGSSPAAGKRGTGVAAQKYALLVGVSRFKYDPRGKNHLKYAANDASRINEYLVKYRGYDKGNVILLINEKATRQKVQDALDKLAAKAQDGDEIFLYFSSHGAPIYDGSLNVVTYDTVFKNHFTMSDSSFPSKSLRDFIERSRSEKVIIVLDVCYSGAAFQGVDGFYHPGAKSISFDDDNQGFSGAAMAKTLLGAKDLRLEDEVDQTPAGADDEEAKVIISASGAGERSWESDSIKASFFTHHLLQELRSGKDLRRAFELSKPRVTTDVRAEKKADQHPQVVTSRKDWGI